jgi:hypothetical protein
MKGLDLEALYRICDVEDKGVVTHREFIDCVKRLKVSLKEIQVKKIIILIDEDCTGYLRYDDYAQTLEAFGFKTNKYKNSSYNKECMGKLFAILVRRSIEPQEFISMYYGKKFAFRAIE